MSYDQLLFLALCAWGEVELDGMGRLFHLSIAVLLVFISTRTQSWMQS